MPGLAGRNHPSCLVSEHSFRIHKRTLKRSAELEGVTPGLGAWMVTAALGMTQRLRRRADISTWLAQRASTSQHQPARRLASQPWKSTPLPPLAHPGKQPPHRQSGRRQLRPSTCKKRQNLAPMTGVVAAWPQLSQHSRSFLGLESQPCFPCRFLPGQPLILFAFHHPISLSAPLSLLR